MNRRVALRKLAADYLEVSVRRALLRVSENLSQARSAPELVARVVRRSRRPAIGPDAPSRSPFRRAKSAFR